MVLLLLLDVVDSCCGCWLFRLLLPACQVGQASGTEGVFFVPEVCVPMSPMPRSFYMSQ